jgi:peptidoglycan/LPS O-acetylase OafA/YrhL
VWLGERSYGLYLWHFPVILVIYERGTSLLPPDTSDVALRLLLIWGLALGLAVLSYKLVEVPARDYGRRLSRRVAERQGLRTPAAAPPTSPSAPSQAEEKRTP